ncbi:MAG: preprotein translocase subunit SecA [Melioribacteraceae bacterium]
MLKGILKKVFGDRNTKILKDLWPIVDEIKAEYEKIKDLTEEELKNKTVEFKAKIQSETEELRNQISELEEKVKADDFDGDLDAEHDELDSLNEELDEKYDEVLDNLLPEAFAVIKATCVKLVGKTWNAADSKITWDMVPYDVQLLGGVVLHQGKIAEMATGEGKTLVGTMPVYLNALTGRGVHLITVNDYLARRDSEWMGEVYKFHGLTVGCILNTMDTDKRMEIYKSDITYGTNNEFGFDYLRDNMAVAKEHRVQRLHNYAIVDEVDSVLIDEARTPLIISGPVGTGEQKYDEMKPKVERLFRMQSSLVASIVQESEKILNEGGDKNIAGIGLLRAQRGFPKNKRLTKMFTEPENKKLMNTTELEYLREKEKRMPEIDNELYFAIDEKNNSINITEKGTEELAIGTNEGKDYFVLPDLATGLNDIESDESLSKEDSLKRKDEMYKDYSEKMDRIHTINQLLKAYSLFEKDDEYVITEEGKIAIVDEFTGRVLPGRRYSDGLHQAIEAKENVKVERDTQTLATITLQNYFRLYKKLSGMTGTAETEEGEFFEIYKLEVVVVPTNKPITRADDDDLIYRTKREKLNAVIETVKELQEEKRPVLVGTTSVELSETLSRMLKRQGIAHNVLNAKQHKSEAEIVAFAGQPGAITIATNMAGRGTDIKLGEGVVDRGGLFILGTERHESRRIDRQLRGRAGRQGDPGTTKFYISLEDDLMRLFSGDKVTSVMSKIGFEEGEALTHSMITKSVERAQKKVEENNFAIRKRLLEYDDVMTQQREVIYTRRQRALEGERLKTEVFEMVDEFVDETLDKHYDDINIKGMQEDILQHLLIEVKIETETFELKGKVGLKEDIIKAANEFYDRKEEMIGAELMAKLERYAVLSVIDEKWKNHLREMDDLKEGIGLRSYGQKDPLVEYKRESFHLFVSLIAEIRNEIVSFCFKYFPQEPEEVQAQRAVQRMSTVKDSAQNMGLQSSKSETAKESTNRGKQQPIKVEKKIGRNDPCHCGSGKKYKNCHG